MVWFAMAAAGFGLLFLGDINSVSWKNRLLAPAFFCGFALIAAAAAGDLYTALRHTPLAGAKLLWLALGVLSCAALCYCLFFAVPFGESYLEDQKERRVCRSGVYALCRHSGVWCFGAACLFFGAAAWPAGLIWRGLCYTALDVLYSYFQDRFIFPRVFTDHGDYCRSVPFLIPTKQSLCRFLKGGKKEERA